MVLTYKCKIQARMLEVHLFRLAFCHICIGNLFQDSSPVVDCCKGSPQIHQPHGGCHGTHVHGAHCLSLHTSIDVMVATADPANRPGDTDLKGLLIIGLRGSSSINDWLISLLQTGVSFHLEYWLWGEAEIELSLLPHCSSIRQ